jgi:hypothetical protein
MNSSCTDVGCLWPRGDSISLHGQLKSIPVGLVFWSFGVWLDTKRLN